MRRFCVQSVPCEWIATKILVGFPEGRDARAEQHAKTLRSHHGTTRSVLWVLLHGQDLVPGEAQRLFDLDGAEGGEDSTSCRFAQRVGPRDGRRRGL